MLADLEGRVPAKYRQVYESLLELLPNGDDCRGCPKGSSTPTRPAATSSPPPAGRCWWTGPGPAAGVLWLRPLWLACWQCWLACVSPKVNRAYVPDGERVAAIAVGVRNSAT